MSKNNIDDNQKPLKKTNIPQGPPLEVYRQGDVLFIKQSEIPSWFTDHKMKTDIILKGETTGHAHRIVNGILYGFELFNSVPEFLIAYKDAKVVHEEHNTIELPEGTYRVRRQREYNNIIGERGVYNVSD
jgi:predicted transcriptional regulator YdeE